jgi:exocyst complex component 4
MCLLHTSMKWLANKIMSMRRLSEQATKSSKRESERFENQRRWTLIASQKPAETDRVYIPLNEETAAAFDGVHHSYLQLSRTILLLIHAEARAHIFFYVNAAMSRTFELDQLLNEPDPEVVALNADLVGLDEELATHLQPAQQSYVTTGLAVLLDAVIIHHAPHIKVMNAAGCGRLQLNILVLQQNLKNIEAGAVLTRSAIYFDMFTSGPEAIIDEARKKGKDCTFTFAQMKDLLRLSYSEGMKSERREIAVAAERGLEGSTLSLSEFLW